MLTLYYHPFASFCQKVLVALYEKSVEFERVTIDLGDPDQRRRLLAVWPMGKFPVLVDGENGRTVPESSAIIDYLDAFAGGARMVPEDAGEAVEARVWDRFFDGFVAVNVTKIVVDRLRPEGRGDPEGVEQARSTLRTAYGVLEERMQGREWAAGGAFGLADCAAAPSLFYAGACEPFHAYPALRGYYERLLGRPSFARAVEEARPFRPLFPLPWPDEYR